MNGRIVRQLILKDLHLFRWISLGALLAGLVAAWLMSMNATPWSAGGILLICALIVLNIFLVMTGIVAERKEHMALFVLTFPISRLEYVGAKVAANVIAFSGPWVILSLAALVAIAVSPMPAGHLPFWLALLGGLFFYYCALLAVGLSTESTTWHATAIIVGNVGVNFFIMLLAALPSVRASGTGETAVWAADVLAVTVGEIALGLAVLAAAVSAHSRRPDHI